MAQPLRGLSSDEFLQITDKSGSHCWCDDLAFRLQYPGQSGVAQLKAHEL